MVDVAATRELCVQLDRTKDSLSRQLASQSVSYEQIQSHVEDLKAEMDLLKQQVQLCVFNMYLFYCLQFWL